MDKIAISIAEGTLVLGQPGLDTVEYLIFELADCDVRRQMSLIDRLDILWRFKSLHEIATGLEQLYWNDIIHQDLKPSNVLVFNRDSSKLADFGRSACDGQKPPHACLEFAGDLSYGPPGVLYRFTLPVEKLRQLSFDAYLLGSMIVFFFVGHGATPLILNELPRPYADWAHYNGTAEDAKLHLRDAFGRFLVKFENCLPLAFRMELVRIVKELCEPDPTRRGHPKEPRDCPSQFSLKRCVTRFDLLKRRAELGLSQGVI